MSEQEIKIGVAGCGALGSIVCDALMEGIEGFALTAVSDLSPPLYAVPNLGFEELADRCDWIVECLPPDQVPALADAVLSKGKTLVMISACALLLYPDLLDKARQNPGRIRVPSGALAGLDAISALAASGIDSATIATTKPPKGLKSAPYVVENRIDLDRLSEKIMVFRGNAMEAAKGFPANVNVAASLSLAGIGPERTKVEIWADPNSAVNRHDVTVIGGNSTIRTSVENRPDPDNPKSSALAGYSIVAFLKRQSAQITTI